ncbi:MAG: efflux transporter outer membrane subunit [Puniceicoccales bacterium]|jgi:multidrug efflux system outer membrane protein|nr:efflux transporter outer membrane subunit [Puniceicoccales bacterium]
MFFRSQHTVFAFLTIAIVFPSACTVGPDYERPVPDEPLPTAFSEKGCWKVPAPRDHLPKGKWWSIYRDPVLDGLIAQASDFRDGKGNPSLLAALARVEQARAIAGAEKSAIYPNLDGAAGASRDRTVSNGTARTENTFSFGGSLRYEVDFWGRVRRLNEAAAARVAASEADFHNALLFVQAETARVYFEVRTHDAERALVVRNIESRRKSLAIVKRRQELGANDKLDLSLAEAELATAESDLIEIDRLRARLRYELAVLCGRNPSTFSINEDASVVRRVPPAIPVGIHSDLLERRLDIASAERTLAASTASIGAAEAAFFPSIVIFGSAGFESVDIKQVMDWGMRKWSLGPALTVPIFDGGRNIANFRRAQALRDEALAIYRQRVLDAFREVESCLGDLSRLAARVSALNRAVAASNYAARLVNIRYRQGSVSYMDVTEAERLAINNERLTVRVSGQRLTASVHLIRAIGGGWDAPVETTTR